MGIHTCGRGTVQRQIRAHLDRRDNGDVYAVLKVRGTDKKYEYCFLGKDAGTLMLACEEIKKHPKFKNISHFEDWCNRYTAEHDI